MLQEVFSSQTEIGNGNLMPDRPKRLEKPDPGVKQADGAAPVPAECLFAGSGNLDQALIEPTIRPSGNPPDTFEHFIALVIAPLVKIVESDTALERQRSFVHQ